MSKLIDYAGLTEFYNKFKDEINAPMSIDLTCDQNDSYSVSNSSYHVANEREYSAFTTKWTTLYGSNVKIPVHFIGVVGNGHYNVGSMLFVRTEASDKNIIFCQDYFAISNISADDALQSSKTGLFLYIFNGQNGQLTVKEITDSSKQDKLTSGTNIKTVNNQSLLGSGNIEISAPSITIDASMSDTSTNPVQNKVIKAYIDGLVGNVAAQLAQI